MINWRIRQGAEQENAKLSLLKSKLETLQISVKTRPVEHKSCQTVTTEVSR